MSCRRACVPCKNSRWHHGSILPPPVHLCVPVCSVLLDAANNLQIAIQLNIVLLGQDRLEKILHEALAEYSCQVELGTELVSYEQVKDGVDVQLVRRGMDPNSEGIPESANYEWVIGADGARGMVRKLSGLTFLGETRRIENLVVGDICVEGLSREVIVSCLAYLGTPLIVI